MSVYWSFLWLAWMAAALLFYRHGRKCGVPKLALFDGLLLSLPLTLLGTHLVFALLNPGTWTNWNWFFLSWSGWRSGHTSFGAVAGALAALFLSGVIHRLPLVLLADCAAPALFVASPIVRLGCFFGGCCYGAATLMPWAVQFPAPNSFQPLTPPNHPTQLYEAITSMLIFLLLPRLFRALDAKPGQGLITSACLFLYFTERFWLEFFRLGGAARAIVFGLSLTHFLTLFGTLVCAFLIWRCRPPSRQHQPASLGSP